jgi:hypothetical protein
MIDDHERSSGSSLTPTGDDNPPVTAVLSCDRAAACSSRFAVPDALPDRPGGDLRRYRAAR